MRNIVLNIFLVLSFAGKAQEKIHVRAEGISISQNLTPKESMEEAIRDAKINGLRKAGIKEELTQSSLLITQEKGDESFNEYREYSSISTAANILVEEILNKSNSFDEFGNLITEVEIKATVYLYSKNEGAGISFKVEGLRDTYYDNDLIKFSIIPSHDAYVSVFVFNENESIQLYPYFDFENDIKDDPNVFFEAHKKTFLPTNPLFIDGYSIEAKSNSEISTMLIVVSKENERFLGDINDKKEFFRWLYTITTQNLSFQVFIIELKKL